MRFTLILAALALTLSALTFNSAFACPGKGKHDGMRAHLEEALSQLPEDKAALVRSTLENMREGRKEKWQAMRAHKDEMRALLTAETFDREAFLAKAEAMHAEKAAHRMAHQKAIADLASQLTAEERVILADILPKHGKKCKMHKHCEKCNAKQCPYDGKHADGETKNHHCQHCAEHCPHAAKHTADNE